VYPVGLDPRWIQASNELNYFNSFKMKFAVIIGVFQMSIGTQNPNSAIFLKMINTVHFGLWLDFLFEWLPQQIFLFSTFGYMCLLIIKKWTVPWGDATHDTSLAPSIIGQMIALPLKLGSTEGKVNAGCNSAPLGRLALAGKSAVYPPQNIGHLGPNNARAQTAVALVEGCLRLR